MRFASFPIAQAEGAVLAHTLTTSDGQIKKGRVLTADDVAMLAAAGHETVVAARLEPGDVAEDVSASRIAAAVAGDGTRVAAPFTGRTNLYAAAAGMAILDCDRISALNRLDESVTIATVAPFERVEAGQMLATVKVITFAVPEAVVTQAEQTARKAIAVAPFQPHSAALVLTVLPATKPAVLDKRTRVTASRLESLGSRLGAVRHVPHDQAAVAAAIRELAAEGHAPILVFSASAIVDRCDVIPAALAAAGGTVVHLGMPVDPGNLLMMGRLGDRDVIGVPSCAASPKINGFDWVLERRLAGLPVGRTEIAAMGIGGLLKEIPTRPQPRDRQEHDPQRRAPSVAAIILAAGRSSRMGPGRNKLLEHLDGKPLVRHAADAALAAGLGPVVVVTGHRADDVRTALAGLDVLFADNPNYGEGLSTSLMAGLSSMPDATDAAIVMLADMPRIAADHLRRLIAAFAPAESRSIVVPVRNGKRGNPVLWGRGLFPAMRDVSGDTGARHLLGLHRDLVVEVDLGTDAIFLDVDTPEALEELVAGRS